MRHTILIVFCFQIFYSTAFATQPIDADTLYFHNELEFHDFLEYHNLKFYDIQPQTDFYDCTTSSSVDVYGGLLSAYHYLHEEIFDDFPFTIIVDHYGTRKIIQTLMPTLEDPDANVCNVNLYITNPITGQVVIFYDEYNWIDENGKNIFNVNKKLYFLWGYDAGTFDFPTEAIQDSTGYDFTFPGYIPGETITLNFDSIDIYNQISFYLDFDGDGFGDNAVSMLAYPFAPPLGYSLNNTDCDDSNSSIYPGAMELCNGMDDNCDGNIDDIASIPVITPLGEIVLCKGSNILLETESGVGYTFQWNRNGNIIPGATSSAYLAIKAGNYNVEVLIDGSCSASSDTTTISVSPKPNATITNLDGTLNLCIDPSIQLKANKGGGFTFQWYFNGTPIAEATNLYYAAESAGDYKVKVTNAYGCTRISAPVTIENVCRTTINESLTEENLNAVIFPSPNNGNFFIQLDNNDKSNIEFAIDIYSAIGQRVYSGHFELEDVINVPILINAQEPGIYYMQIQNADLLEVIPFQLLK